MKFVKVASAKRQLNFQSCT